jgi:hypothetical protein
MMIGRRRLPSTVVCNPRTLVTPPAPLSLTRYVRLLAERESALCSYLNFCGVCCKTTANVNGTRMKNTRLLHDSNKYHGITQSCLKLLPQLAREFGGSGCDRRALEVHTPIGLAHRISVDRTVQALERSS